MAAQHLDGMLKMDRVYLAHEYLDEHWDLFQFSEVASRLAQAKLAFVASATLTWISTGKNSPNAGVSQRIQRTHGFSSLR